MLHHLPAGFEVKAVLLNISASCHWSVTMETQDKTGALPVIISTQKQTTDPSWNIAD